MMPSFPASASTFSRGSGIPSQHNCKLKLMIAEEGCAEALEGPEEKGVLEPEMDTGVCLGSTRALGAGEGGGA